MASAKQIAKIRRIVQKYMNVLMHITAGEGESISPAILKKFGIPKGYKDLITTAYELGKLKGITNLDLNSLTDAEIEKAISKMTLTVSQKRALDYLKLSAGDKIAGLSNNIINVVVNGAVVGGISQIQGIRETLEYGLATAQTRQQVATSLREITGDWERDWNRVAHTEMWNARLNGEVITMLDGTSPLTKDKGDTTVFKRPAPNACAQCKKAYLESDGITPKLFKLSDLLANGTNYGKKTAEWLPVAGVMHPNCMCPLSIMPEGAHFDDEGQISLD